jgi:hypothetical protein
MAEKWSGEESEIAVSAVGSDVLALGETPNSAGPFTLRGALPPELRDLARIWIEVDESDNASVYGSKSDSQVDARAIAIDSWDLSPDMASLSAVDAELNTLDSVDTIPATASAGTSAVLGTPLAISAVTHGADTLTRVGHGLVVGDGPYYVASTGDIPTGLAATTPYWIQAVPTADTFTLAATLGGAVIDITDAGTGDITLVPVNVDVSLETIAFAAHGLSTGDGPFQVSNGGALPTGLSASTDYWVIAATAGRLKFATSRVNALDGTAINLTAIGSGTTTLTRINVDLLENTLRSVAHGIETGQLVRLSTDGALPTGLSAATNYWAVAVDADHLGFASSLENAEAETLVNLTAVGSGTTTVSACNVDTTLDSLTFATEHGLETGDAVQVSTGTTLPTGISAATTYYVVALDEFSLSLSDTEAHALAETDIIDITAIGAGTQTVTLVGVEAGDDTLRVVAHGMQTGDGPVRVSTTGVLPTGLVAATDYWVIRVSADFFKLAASSADALASTPVNITAIGSGDHQLVRALTIGKDLSAGGILEWLAQGVSREQMQLGELADVETIFV